MHPSGNAKDDFLNFNIQTWFRCGMALYFGAECKLPTLLSFEPAISTTASTVVPTTMYSTTSTARPTTTTSVTTTTIETSTKDPLSKCQIDGLPSNKEDGKKELEELIEYEVL